MTINIKGSIVPDAWASAYEKAGLGYCCPGELAQALDKAGGQQVDIAINSPGGSVDAAREIYAAIRRYPGPKQIHVVGMAASAASVIACAGPSDISPIGMLLLHNVRSPGIDGDYHAQDKESQILQQVGRSLAAAYVDKSGMSLEAALALMDKESTGRFTRCPARASLRPLNIALRTMSRASAISPRDSAKPMRTVAALFFCPLAKISAKHRPTERRYRPGTLTSVNV